MCGIDLNYYAFILLKTGEKYNNTKEKATYDTRWCP